MRNTFKCPTLLGTYDPIETVLQGMNDHGQWEDIYGFPAAAKDIFSFDEKSGEFCFSLQATSGALKGLWENSFVKIRYLESFSVVLRGESLGKHFQYGWEGHVQKSFAKLRSDLENVPLVEFTIKLVETRRICKENKIDT